MAKYQKIWWLLWTIFFITCLLSYIYMIFTKENLYIINIEYKFYLSVLGMAAVSMAPIKFGKILLWFVLFCSLSSIYNLPEFQKITELEACAEGKCNMMKEIDTATMANKEDKDTQVQNKYPSFYKGK